MCQQCLNIMSHNMTEGLQGIKTAREEMFNRRQLEQQALTGVKTEDLPGAVKDLIFAAREAAYCCAEDCEDAQILKKMLLPFEGIKEGG